MRKPKEIEELIKRAIRDDIALFPLKSVAQVRNTLYLKGYQSLRGELDWHYVSRLMKKIREENLVDLTVQDRTTRLANLKERHRVVTQRLAMILSGSSRTEDLPTYADRIAAANSILKWDMALFFAEDTTEKVETEKELLLVYKERSRISGHQQQVFQVHKNKCAETKDITVRKHLIPSV